MNNIRKIYCKKHVINCLSKRFYSDAIRVRFAPSPTGYLHLGGLRTALYNYLFAKSKNGKFILRIEDTDQTRLVEGAVEKLQEDLQWAGIVIDEGPKVGGDYGPYIQSERVQFYKNELQTLLDNGSAYFCFCSDRRLNLLRKEAIKMRQVPKYDNRCRYLSPEEVRVRLGKGEKHCVRFKLLPDCETFEDMIYGNIAFDVASIEGDPVIMKSDGFPTYHFANVVDDHYMKISHVLRGVEWQVSTTKHILMYRAFNWEPPVYGHLPLLLNADGTKLSKRQGDIKISHFRESGIYPQGLINFITNSGGGFSKDLERHLKPKSYTMEELSQQFDITLINSHSGKLMSERLFEFNRLEIKRKLKNAEETKELVEEVQKLVLDKFESNKNLEIDDEHVKYILSWASNRITKLSDLVSNDLAFLWIVHAASHEHYNKEDLEIIRNLSEALAEQEFGKDKLSGFLKVFSTDAKYPFKKLMKVLREIISGSKQGPAVAEMLELLGKKNTTQRLEMFLKNYR